MSTQQRKNKQVSSEEKICFCVTQDQSCEFSSTVGNKHYIGSVTII